MQALFLSDGILVIPGTNEKKDWVKYNLNLARLDGVEGEAAFAVSQGASGRDWHAGFLDHARRVYEFAEPLKPRYDLGHSLGAASAQIVGSSLKVPTFAFASPKPYRSSVRRAGARFVLNICREDDLVCEMPPRNKFRHIGRVIWVAPKKNNWGLDHNMHQYIKVMKEPGNKNSLPERWPT